MKPGPRARAFLELRPYPADRFQVEAIAAIEAGESVVVTAPTGSGKTLVAEAAIHLTLENGQRAFYTTPIKALSNQKFGDLRQEYGTDRVGLLTGDNSLNGEAPVVVMTTEVLRNMIYSRSSALDDLGAVVLDEVHYLQDRHRGSVWEEVIIHLPQRVQLVSLSATIANADEFTGWLRSRRGATRLVVERDRPVPLDAMYMVRDRHHGNESVLLPMFGRDGKRPNPQVQRMFRSGRNRSRRFSVPRRTAVAAVLEAENLLPAIYFIFSRAACDRAARTVAGSDLRLTDGGEADAIAAAAEQRTAHLSPTDLAVVGFEGWVEHLRRGVAAHHAGMVPAFKETVEELFARGLVKLVFATETLALGINMPARSVVLENLSKFTGERHEMLRGGDFLQLTGRAGRRGIDVRGVAVTLYSPYVPFDRAAGIAAAGSHPLVSSFQPSYNMAVNLVSNYEHDRAEELLRASFAHFREESRREDLGSRATVLEAEAEVLREKAECERGDIWDFAARGSEADSPGGVWALLRRLQPGDVLDSGPDTERMVLLARSWGGRSPLLLLLAEGGAVRRTRPADLGTTVRIVGTLDLPEPFRPRDRDYQRDVASQLQEWSGTGAGKPVVPEVTNPDPGPVGSCPRLDEHLGAVREVVRVEREARRLRRRMGRRGDDLIGRFDAVLGVLGRWGYVDGWKLTDRGEALRQVYNERDLLLTEAVEPGLLSGLSAPELAAVASVFTFDPRAADVEGGWPTALTADRWFAISGLWDELNDHEASLAVPETRPPEPGFDETVHGWAAGLELDDLYGDEDFAAGDFVRNCRQLLDLLRQVRDAFSEMSEDARSVIAVVDRGIVAAGGRW